MSFSGLLEVKFLKPFGHQPTAVKPLASNDFKRASPKGPALNLRAWSMLEGNK